MSILLGATLGIIFAQTLLWVLGVLAKPFIDKYEEREWEKFRKSYKKRTGRYPLLRHTTI